MGKVLPKSAGMHQQSVSGDAQLPSANRSGKEKLPYLSVGTPLPRPSRRKAEKRSVQKDILMSQSSAPLRAGSDKMGTLLRFTLFVDSLKTYAMDHSMAVVDLISGSKGQSVIKHLYHHQWSFAVTLLEDRLNAYQCEYGERAGMFDSEEGSEAEQDIADMLEKIGRLKQQKDPDLFSLLLDELHGFERAEDRVPYEDRCDLALLKLAGVVQHPYMKAMPADMLSKVDCLLDPDDISVTQGWPWGRHSAAEVTDAVKLVCIEEGAKHQRNLLKKTVKELFDTGLLDLEHYTAEDNIKRLCDTNEHSMQSVWVMVDAYYREWIRANPEEKNRLHEYKQSQNRSAFIKALLCDDENLRKWVKGALARELLEHHENVIKNDLKAMSGAKAALWRHRLKGFVRQAETAGYVVDPVLVNRLETLQIAEMQRYIQEKGKADNPLWLTGESYTHDEIKKHLHATNPCEKAKRLRLLRDYLLVSAGVKSLEEERSRLLLKDQLLKTQVEYLFNKARQHIDNRTDIKSVSKQKFESYLNNIVLLEELRPPVSVMDTCLSFTNMINAIGCSLIRMGEVPVSQRLRDISLEYQLKHHFDYSFKTEMGEQVASIPGQLWGTLGAVVGQVTGTIGLVYNTAMGRVCLVDACKKSMELQKGATNALLDAVRKQLTDYAELCKHNPHMARVLAGNIAQTIAVIENAGGTGSELYAIFHQFKQRISAEAMASYMAEQFNQSDMDISSLEEDEAAALKRMFALCQFFRWAPEAVVGATGTAEVVRQAASGSTLGIAWSAVKTAFKVGATHMVKQGVSSMPDDEVRAVNAAIMTWQHGHKEAALRLQALQTAAEFMADQAKGYSVSYSAVRALLRPLTTRFSRLRKAHLDWKTGKNPSCLSVISESIKIATIVTPVIASVVATPIIATVLGPALIGYTLTVGPLVALGLISFYYQWDPAEDMVVLLNNKLTSMLKPGLPNLTKRAEEEAKIRMKSGGYMVIKRHIAYERLYHRFWPGFETQHPALAKEIENKFEANIATDVQYQEKEKQLIALRRELMNLEPLLEGSMKSSDVVNIVSGELKKSIPRDDAAAAYWAVTRIHMIKETLHQALGTEAVPASDESVAIRFRLFSKRLAMVEIMRQSQPQITKCLPGEIMHIGPSMEEVVKDRYRQAYVVCTRIAMHYSLVSMVGAESLSKDRLNRLISRRQDYHQRLKQQLESMKRVFSVQLPLPDG